MLDSIIQVLINLRNALKSLFEAASAKQKALISLNYEALEAAIILEEKMLSVMRECEEARIKSMNDFYTSQNIEHSSYKLSELCSKLDAVTAEKELKRVRLLEKQIKSAISEINKINHQNVYIIQHSRNFIKDTIASLVSSNKSFLDRRV